jgi:hypothetical protein
LLVVVLLTVDDDPIGWVEKSSGYWNTGEHWAPDADADAGDCDPAVIDDDAVVIGVAM